MNELKYLSKRNQMNDDDKTNFLFLLCVDVLKELNRPVGATYDEIKYFFAKIGFNLRHAEISSLLLRGITSDIIHTKSGRFYLNQHINKNCQLKYKEEKNRKSRDRIWKKKNLNREIFKNTKAAKFCGKKLTHLERLIELDLKSSCRNMVEPSGNCCLKDEVEITALENAILIENESSNSVKNKNNEDYFTGNCFLNEATSSESTKENSLSIPAYYNQIDTTKQISVCDCRNRNLFNIDENSNAEFEKFTSDIESYFETYLKEILPVNHNNESNLNNGDQSKFLQPSNNEAERMGTRNNFSEEIYNDNFINNSDSPEVFDNKSKSADIDVSEGSKAVNSNPYESRIIENPLNNFVSNKYGSNQNLNKNTENNNQLKYSLFMNANNNADQTRKVILLNETLDYQPNRPPENTNVQRINYPKTVNERFIPSVIYDTESEESIKDDYYTFKKISFGQYIKIKSKCLTMCKNRSNNSITIYCQHCTNKKKRNNTQLKRNNNLRRTKNINNLDKNKKVGQNLRNQRKIGLPLWRYFNSNHQYSAHTSCNQ